MKQIINGNCIAVRILSLVSVGVKTIIIVLHFPVEGMQPNEKGFGPAREHNIWFPWVRDRVEHLNYKWETEWFWKNKQNNATIFVQENIYENVFKSNSSEYQITQLPSPPLPQKLKWSVPGPSIGQSG